MADVKGGVVRLLWVFSLQKEKVSAASAFAPFDARVLPCALSSSSMRSASLVLEVLSLSVQAPLPLYCCCCCCCKYRALQLRVGFPPNVRAVAKVVLAEEEEEEEEKRAACCMIALRDRSLRAEAFVFADGS